MSTTAALTTFSTALGRFVPTLAEQGRIADLPRDVRQKLDLWLTVMGRCHLARQLKPACAELEAELAATGLRGFGAENIKRTFLRFRASGWSWEELVPAYHLPAQTQPRGHLPPAFLTWWQRHAGTFSGGTRAAHAELAARWQRGEEIEGLGTWMRWWQERQRGQPLPAVPPPLPPGCSYDNLLDKLPHGAELTVVREGFASADAELPILRRDRSELRALELVTFDDHPLDYRVAAVGVGQVCKLLGLFALDVACGFLADHAAGARTENAEGIQRSLTRADGRALVFQFLRRYGVPRHWKMHLLFERASFAIDETDADFLEKLSPNIVIDRTPIRRRALLAGGPVETHGSPQAKGWLESYFNLLDRACSAAPGQAGRNPLTAKKGDIDAVEAEARTTLALLEGLPPAIQNLASLHLLTAEQGKVFLHEMVARLNHRQRHRLQGFDLVPRWRIRGLATANPWRPIAELPPGLADAAIEIEHFHESPAERFARLYRVEDFDLIPEAVLLPLLDDKKEVRVERPYQITFQHRRITRTYTLDDPRLEKIGTEFVACLDPQAPESIYLLDRQGAYVGQATLWRGPSPVDREQIAEAARTVKAQQHRLLKRAQELHAPRAQERLDQLAAGNERLAGAVAEIEASRMQLTAAEQASADLVAARPRPPRRQPKRDAAHLADRAALAREARDSLGA